MDSPSTVRVPGYIFFLAHKKKKKKKKKKKTRADLVDVGGVLAWEHGTSSSPVASFSGPSAHAAPLVLKLVYGQLPHQAPQVASCSTRAGAQNTRHDWQKATGAAARAFNVLVGVHKPI